MVFSIDFKNEQIKSLIFKNITFLKFLYNLIVAAEVLSTLILNSCRRAHNILLRQLFHNAAKMF